MKIVLKVLSLQVPNIATLSFCHFSIILLILVQPYTELQWPLYVICMALYVISTIVKLRGMKRWILGAQAVIVVLLWLIWNELQWVNQLWLPLIFEMQFIYRTQFTEDERFTFLSCIFLLFNFSFEKEMQPIGITVTLANILLFYLWHRLEEKPAIDMYPWLQGQYGFILNQEFKIISDYRNQNHDYTIIDIEFQQYLNSQGSIGFYKGLNIIKDSNQYIIFKIVEEQSEATQLIQTKHTEFTKADKLLDFSKSIAHELSTCLNGILTLSYIAVTEPRISTELKETYLQPILANSQQLELIVKNLKDYNDIKAKAFMSEIQQFDIIAETRSVIKFFSMALEEKQIQIKIKQLLLDVNVYNDKVRYKQVLYQLLSNAVRYSKYGSIIIKFKKSMDQIQISVKDQGIGMDNEEQAKLQQIINSTQLHRVSKFSVGCGLGICVSNIILLELSLPQSRQLKFKSQYNVGSKFQFWITDNSEQNGSFQMMHSIKSPKSTQIRVLYNLYSYVDCQFDNVIYGRMLSSNRKSNQRKSRIQSFNHIKLRFAEPESLEYNNIDSSGEFLSVQYPPIFLEQEIVVKFQSNCCAKILIVDDECFNIYVMEKILAPFTNNTNRAFNGEEAMQKIYDKPICEQCGNQYYQLIMLDVNMPIKDGIDTVRDIKQLENNGTIKKTVCIANSAFSDLATKSACFDAGMDYYITKPIDVSFFRELITKIFKL